LQEAIGQLEDWVSTLPKESRYYLNMTIPNRHPPFGSNVSKLELNIADAFFDLHSSLAGQCLIKSWRAAQLVDGLENALSTWNLTMAAMAARALVETASAWSIESNEFAALWMATKAKRLRTFTDISNVRHDLFVASMQMSVGTRLPHIAKDSKMLQRTNILTLVQKAAKAQDRYQTLWQDYEILCDAVHPSWGSSECFWAEAGFDDVNQYRVLLSRSAVGQLSSDDAETVRPGSGLFRVILSTASWACLKLTADLQRFHRMCCDMCLTSRIFIFGGQDYWGIVSPRQPDEACACGSGAATRDCRHVFG